ncbi:polyketide antibiotic transporter [Kineococcus sp. T13]|nr:polyketide antibiotic transporter [Kineococcus vitellinus]
MRVPAPAPAPVRARAAGRAVVLLALEQVRRGALVVALVAAALTAVVAASHDRVAGDPATTASLRVLAGNPAVRALFGEPAALGTVGGYTAWRAGTVVAVLLATWAVLVTTRTTRGAEESGAWSLLLSGCLPLRSVVARHLAVLALAPLAVGAAVAVALRLAGAGTAAAAVSGAGTALVGVLAVALAGLSAQLLPTRGGAAGAAVGALSAGLLVRAVGDGVDGLSWLRWASPFGLLELSRPAAGDRVAPLLVLAVAATALGAAAVAAAGRREVGEGLWSRRAVRRAPRGGLGSVEAFALRRCLRPVLAWSAGIGAYYLLTGLVATSVTGFLDEQAGFAGTAARAGFGGLDSVEGFSASLFGLLPVPVGAFAAARLAASTAAEADRRSVLLAAQPVGRLRLLGAELTATTAGTLLLVSVAAVCTWAGTSIGGGGLGLGAALRGTWNTLPVALLAAGAAALAVGCLPRAVVLVGLLPVGGGFLLRVVAESAGAPAWVVDLSPFSHLAAVPLVPADRAAGAVLTALALALAAAGALAHRRRDLLG